MDAVVYEGFGIDMDWYAVDCEGAVGHFTTGGSGEIPPPGLGHLRPLMKKLDQLMEGLPFRGAAVVVADAPDGRKRHPTWLESLTLGGYVGSAERGLYSHDVRPPNSVPTDYVLMTRPSNPLKVQDLSEEIRALLAEVRCCRNHRFARETVFREL